VSFYCLLYSLMADYFLLLDAKTFEGEVRPALAACWRQRSFEPCRALCAGLASAARSYAERYHVGGESLVVQAAGGLPFDRAFWRLLVGEVLLVAAIDIPEFQTAPETLARLLAPDFDPLVDLPRERRPPIVQAHQGSRDLTFGAAAYRPEFAGWNDARDVARLADYLAAVRPEEWTTAALRGLPGDEEEHADELAFAREWFPMLRDLYRGARDRGQVLVIEQVY
jgi:hypothetical protein